MSKIVFFSIPAHGHTNPTLPVVKELVSRGHQVWYYSYNLFREKIEKCGATFISCDDYNMEQKLNKKDAVRVGKDMAFSIKLLVDTTLSLDEKICSDMKEISPDCIVCDSMALWGKAVAMKMDIPYVVSTTTFAFNRHSSKIIKQSVVDLFKMILAMPKATKEIKRLQDKGYPIKSVLDVIGSDENAHAICYTSPQFQPCADTFSDKYAFVGPLVRQEEKETEKKREKLIYISMGTVNNDMMHFYKKCIQAFGNTDYQVIMSVGNLVYMEKFKNLPENISVFSHVDQISVLKEADVFISHCGMNSVSESLYFEVPLVMLPQTTEQKGVSERVLQLGGGIRPKKRDAKTILDATEEILKNDIYKKNVKKISEGFKKCSGADGAADKIIEVCNKTEK